MIEEKEMFFLKKRLDRSGMILIVVMWILIILSLLAIGLGRRTSIDLKMTKHALGKLRAKYTAQAGLVFALEQVKRDNENAETKLFDNLRQCGFGLIEGESREDVFKSVKVGEGFFNIGKEDNDTVGKENGEYGFSDEERKININALDQNNYTVLQYLMMELGYEEGLARSIAASVVDWRDGDDTVFEDASSLGVSGAESDYYDSLDPPYFCKNTPFDSITEIRHVKNVTKEIFADIKKYITIFPKSGKFLVNLDTASEKVLLALAKHYTGNKTKTNIYDAESLVEKMLAYREGYDNEEGTEDDRLLEINEMALNVKEKVLFLMMKGDQTKVSRYIRFFITGVDEKTSISSKIDAIIHRDDLTIVYWARR